MHYSSSSTITTNHSNTGPSQLQLNLSIALFQHLSAICSLHLNLNSSACNQRNLNHRMRLLPCPSCPIHLGSQIKMTLCKKITRMKENFLNEAVMTRTGTYCIWLVFTFHDFLYSNPNTLQTVTIFMGCQDQHTAGEVLIRITPSLKVETYIQKVQFNFLIFNKSFYSGSSSLQILMRPLLWKTKQLCNVLFMERK